MVDKVNLIIAESQFVYSFGIKTMLASINSNIRVFEIYDVHSLKNILKTRTYFNYLIISDNFITHSHISFQEIEKMHPFCKLLFIGEQQRAKYIINNANQAKTLAVLKQFCGINEVVAMQNMISLTKREQQVLVFLAQGKTQLSIATLLGITKNTVMSHRKNIGKKTGKNSIAKLTEFAVKHKLI